MSTTTNVIAAQKGLYHGQGANSSDLDSAVDALHDIVVTVNVPGVVDDGDGNASAAASASGSILTTVPVNCKLVSAYFCTVPTITSTAGDTVTLNVTTNGVAAVNFDSDDLASASGANTVVALTVDDSNSFVDAGEAVNIIFAAEDGPNNFLQGTLVLGFRRQ